MTLKIEAGKKYRTRGGDEAEVLKVLETPTNPADAVIGVLLMKDGLQGAITHYANGAYTRDDNHYLDLISEVKPKRVVWLNVYEGDDTGSCFFRSRQEADEDDQKYDTVNVVRIACIRVEFEEERFDE